MPTIAEKYRNEGKKEGEKKGKIEALGNFLQSRFSMDSGEIMDKIRSINNLALLDSLLSNIFRANSIDEVKEFVDTLA